MHSLLALAPLLAPLSLLSVALVAAKQRGTRPRAVLALSRVASALSLLVALAVATLAVLHGPFVSPLLGIGEVGLSLRIDALSAVMFALVAFLGAVVLHYSRAYLDGDARHGVFMGRLALTIASVMLLVLSGNLVQLVITWIATSFALHELLVFYPERPGAIIAARKKFVVARIGDVSLVAAALLLYLSYGTLDLGTLLARAAEAPVTPLVSLAAGCTVLTAALKSAQFPTHGWLAEVMETPTPVSALLHAGILNGGTFLVARLAAVMVLSPSSMHAMVLIGGFTALFASVVMITQSSIKVQLAYSSAAHMGFMLLVCGLGGFPMAIMHLVAHSCYKAHAFLSSGSAVDVHRAARVPGKAAVPKLAHVLSSFAVAMATVSAVGLAFGASLFTKPVALGLAVTLALALTQLLGQALHGHARSWVLVQTVLLSALVSAAFFGLERVAHLALHDSLPLSGPVTLATVVVMTFVVLSFALAVVLQLLLPSHAADPRWARAYVHLRNGLYANALFDRLVGLPAPSARTLSAPQN